MVRALTLRAARATPKVADGSLRAADGSKKVAKAKAVGAKEKAAIPKVVVSRASCTTWMDKIPAATNGDGTGPASLEAMAAMATEEYFWVHDRR